MSHIQITDQEFPAEAEMAKWAWKAMKKESWSEAAKRWNLIREIYPKCEDAWVQGGVVESQLENLEAAEQLLKQACELFPNSSSSWMAYADLQLEIKGLVETETLLSEIQDRFPQIPYPYLKRSEYALHDQNFQRAVSENKLAREYFPTEVTPLIQYAQLAEYQDDLNEAMHRWEQVRSLFPEDPAGYKYAAQLARKSGDNELAKHLRALKKIATNSSDVEKEKDATLTEERLIPLKTRNWAHMAELIWTKSRLNLKSEANQNYLRHVWWVLDPLLYMTVFYLVFGLLLQRGGEGYLGYLLTGLVPFQWFAKTTQISSNSILGGRGLMNQVRIPPIFFPLVVVTQTAGKQMMIFAMLILFLLFYGVDPNVSWLGLIPILFVQLLLVTMTASLIAMVIPFVRDLSNLVPTGIQLVMFSSAIFYSVETLSDKWKFYFYLNPVATLIHEYRAVLLDGNWPDWMSLVWVLLFSVVGLITIAVIYRRISFLYPRVVIE